MRYLTTLLALIVTAMLGFSLTGQTKTPSSGLYAAITQEEEWLNVSRPLTPDDLNGRIILLDFWTFCCINCIHIMPDLQYLEEKFGDKLTVIGVHSAKFNNEQETDNIRQAVLRYGLHHPVVNDANFRIWKSFGVRSWPTLVLIAPNGRIANVYSGEGHRNELEHDISALIDSVGPTLNASPLPYALEKDKAPPTILSFPGKATYAPDRDLLFVSDSGHHRIVGINPKDGTITLTIGSGKEGKQDGSFETAAFHTPQGMAYRDGILYVADTDNHLLRKVDLTTEQVSTIAGTGWQGYEREVWDRDARSVPLASPWDLAFYPDNEHLTIAMAGTHQLWQYDIAKGTVRVLAGNGRESIDDGRYPANSLSQPSGLAAYGDRLYFVDSETSSLRMLQGTNVTTLIGTGLFDFGYLEGTRDTARMQHPLGVYADDSGVYIADSYNHAIRHYAPESGRLSNFAGTGTAGDTNGTLASAQFNEPNDLLKIGDRFYVVDTNNQRLQVLSGGTTSTLPVMPQQHSDVTYSDTLPNLVSLPAATMSGSTAVTVELDFKEGWKINHLAPSYLALFTKNGNHYQVVQSFSKEELENGQITLPQLTESKNYLLQGTLYYCQDKVGSQCLIKSIELPISARANASATYTLPVNTGDSL